MKTEIKKAILIDIIESEFEYQIILDDLNDSFKLNEENIYIYTEYDLELFLITYEKELKCMKNDFFKH